MTFFKWLLVSSLAFVILERIIPWRKNQPLLRKQFGYDLFYLCLNGHLVGFLLSFFTPTLGYGFDVLLGQIGLSEIFSLGFLSRLPFIWEFLICFFIYDFLQWCIHNLLHRNAFLWQFHKTHHSIVEMDWIGHMRFHWVEGLIYRTLMFLPLTFFDFDPRVLLSIGILSLILGYFNHSNLDINIGKLGYFFNNPRMHIWHHTDPECGPTLCNFGLNLSLWDWIFGTAYVPENQFPEKIGLGKEDPFPQGLLSQLIYPLSFKGKK